MLALLVQIRHTAPQARLQEVGIPSEEPHDHAPADARKHGPRVLLRAPAPRGGTVLAEQVLEHAGPAAAARGRVAGLEADGRVRALLGRDGQLREAEADAREDVDDNLLVDAALALVAAPEDDVAGEDAGDEGVGRGLPPEGLGGDGEGGGAVDCGRGARGERVQEEHKRLVAECKGREVGRMLPGCG